MNNNKPYIHEVLSGSWRISWWKSETTPDYLSITLRYDSIKVSDFPTEVSSLSPKIDLTFLGKKLLAQLTTPDELNSSIVARWADSKATGVEL